MEQRLAELKREMADSDWKVIKAARLGVTVEELYPGESAWYAQQVVKINALEKELAAYKKGEKKGS
jgi:hypothetical protein